VGPLTLPSSTPLRPCGYVGHGASNPDADDVWDKLTLEQRRVILRSVLTVTLLPTGRGRGFKESSVQIESAA
jgi:hypothetical protein